ncbi:MAG: DUF971 domain-containing protein [Gammaproteobacteria bacterium]
MSNPELIEIKLLQKERELLLTFENDQRFSLSCEYLRVFSPSAEVRGHGKQEMQLVAGKQNVNIIGMEPVGNYAVKLVFDDGHDTGLYTWEFLYELGLNQQQNWDYYLQRLQQAQLSREAVNA